MKRFTAILLIVTVFSGCLITSCSDRDNRRDRDNGREEEADEDRDDEDDEDDDIVSTTTTAQQTPPRFQTQSVQEERSFGDYTATAPGTPWVLENNIPFSTAPVIETYFNQFITDSAYTVDLQTEIINNVATITRPVVRHYPAQQPGYTVYEISYSETIPNRAVLPDTYDYNTLWFYHGVGYLDYYTGTVYPTIELSTSTDSYCVYGNIEFNGETYTVYHYAFREEDFPVNEVTTGDDGEQIWEITNVATITDYFIVPNGYDGIVMFIYTADDSDRSFEEVMADNTPFYTEPHIFGEEGYDETIEDHTFLSIASLG